MSDPTTSGRGVHFSSPSFESELDLSVSFATASEDATSAFEFLNSQLVAHGFAYSPGLDVEGLGKTQQGALAKCLMGMMQQRIDDMGRIEDLTANLRTLTYDHERLQSMYKAAQERAAQAERSASSAHSKHHATLKLLSTSEQAHKHTLSHLTRTQSALLTVRAHAQAEIKKKEKELEKMGERWNKIASEQTRLAAQASGVKNSSLLSSSGTSVAPSDPLLEQSLAELEQTRQRLVEENEAFRSVLLALANTLQNMLASEPPLPQILAPTLFTPSLSQLAGSADWQAQNAHAKLRELCSAVRDRLAAPPPVPETPPQREQIDTAEMMTAIVEIDRLNEDVRRLRAELEESKAIADRGQRLMQEFAKGKLRGPSHAEGSETPLAPRSKAESSREALDKRAKELEEERAKFTEATVRLGKERAEIQAERADFEEQKRKFALQQLLSDLPPTPAAPPAQATVDPSPSPRRKKRIHSPVKQKQRRTSTSTAAPPKQPKTPTFPHRRVPLVARDYRPAVSSPLKTMTLTQSTSSSSNEDDAGGGEIGGDKENVRVKAVLGGKRPSIIPSTGHAHVVGNRRRSLLGGSAVKGWR